MFEIYYYNQGVYHFQGSYETLKEAKEHFNAAYKGYIKKGEKVYKRYK